MVKKDTVLIIIPCYNEAERLNVKHFENQNFCKILFVNDGSNDRTSELIDKLTHLNKGISSLQLEKNVGKAEAIRQGVLFLNGKYSIIGYLDADLSTSLEEMKRLIQIHQSGNFQFTMGSRLKIAGSQIKRYWWRHFSGRVIATIIDGIFLKSGIYDTQCGAKVINEKTAQRLFKTPFETKWLFDVELLLRLKQDNESEEFINIIKEVPLSQWVDDGDTRISLSDILKLPISFYKIYKRYL